MHYGQSRGNIKHVNHAKKHINLTKQEECKKVGGSKGFNEIGGSVAYKFCKKGAEKGHRKFLEIKHTNSSKKVMLGNFYPKLSNVFSNRGNLI